VTGYADRTIARWRARLRVRDGATLLLAIVLGAALGRSIANGGIMIVGLVSGCLFIVALAQRPWLPYVACAALVSTFATPSSLPQFGLPGQPALTDFVLFAAFAAWLLVIARGEAERPSAFPLAPQLLVGIFLLAAVGGIFVGTANGAQSAVSGARDISYYAVFWLALTTLGNLRQRAFILKLAATGAVVLVCAQVLQGFFGLHPMLFYDHDPLRELIRCPSGGCADPKAEGFPRVRPPGLVLIYVVACFATSYLLWGPQRRRRLVLALLAVCMIGILVSLNRNMLIGLTAGLLLAGLLAARRGRFAVVAAALIIVAFSSLELVRHSPSLQQNTIAARVLSIEAASQVEQSASIQDRLRENGAALDALSKSPVEGVGWGVSYGVSDLVFENGEFTEVARGFIHNQYLGLWLRTGLLGLVSFLALLGLSIGYGTRYLRSRPDEDAWIGAGVITSLTAISVSSLVAIYVIEPSWAAITAGLMALATNLERDLLKGT
jgi:O-antigen ligase